MMRIDFIDGPKPMKQAPKFGLTNNEGKCLFNPLIRARCYNL